MWNIKIYVIYRPWWHIWGVFLKIFVIFIIKTVQIRIIFNRIIQVFTIHTYFSQLMGIMLILWFVYTVLLNEVFSWRFFLA